jgi:hypothetical protein
MNEKTQAIIFITIAAVLLTTFTTTLAVVKAASMSDNQNPIVGSNTNTTSVTPQSTNNDTKMFITAVPEKGIITRGTTETIDISTKTDNGTAIPDVDIQSIVVGYASSHQKTLLGGATDDKGELKVSAQIGPHAHAGQFLVTVEGKHPNFDTAQISTGFAVVDKAKSGSSSSGSSSSGSSSSGKSCSGSSCS